jgi:hypothetical protein
MYYEIMKKFLRCIVSILVFLPIVLPFSTIHAQTLQGDANGDRKVDGIDFVVWLNHYNQTTTNGASFGDFNANGKVDGVDFVIWLNNYGKTATPTPTHIAQTPTNTSAPTPTPLPCVSGTTTWFGTHFTPQTGNFVIKYSATPQANNITGVFAAGPVTPLSYNDAAVLVRFNLDGTIQAFDGLLYRASTTVNYTANTQYNFRIFVNFTGKTYSVFVTPQGGVEKEVAQDFSFRSTQSAATSIEYFTSHSSTAADAFQLCGFTIPTYSNSPTPLYTPTPIPDCYVKVAGFVYNIKAIINILMTDETSSKTNTHVFSTLQCGTQSSPTDVTALYLEKHTPLGCWARIAPYSITKPAPPDPSCQ